MGHLKDRLAWGISADRSLHFADFDSVEADCTGDEMTLLLAVHDWHLLGDTAGWLNFG